MHRRPPLFVVPLILAACGAPALTHPVAPTAPPAEDEGPPPSPDIPEGDLFVVYDGEGRRTSLEAVGAAMSEAEVVLVGEEHDDPVTHGVQRMLLEAAFGLYGSERDVVLSLEMFERDIQGVLDEYLAGLITESHFLASARPWERYDSDYKPMVEFARYHDLEVVAANAPRRYVNRASRLGRESLTELTGEALRYLPPLPYPGASDAYRAEWDDLMGEAAPRMPESALDGQTLWDAAMAHAIARRLDREPQALVLHMAGVFHVQNETGIAEALTHYRPWTRVLSVVARPVDDPTIFDDAEHGETGDFVVLTRRMPGG